MTRPLDGIALQTYVRRLNLQKNGSRPVISEGESCRCGKLHLPFTASAATQGAPQAIQVADRFHICKNLTEATQLLLARCQAEIVAASKQEEPAQNESGQPIISIEEWRPKEPAHVEKVRLTRRAGREARYEQVMERHSQGLTAKEIACQLGLSQRTVQKWLAAGTFPEAKKRRKKRSDFDLFARLSAQTVAGGGAKWSHYEGYPLVALCNLKGIERLTLHNTRSSSGNCSRVDAK
jgi:DNA-binding transcriptional ArsR family regulator